MARIGFVTCVELGRACMEAVLADGGTFSLAVTLDDAVAPDKSGRITLDDLAERHEFPLLKVRNINDQEVIEALRDAALDWLLIIGWSQIARRDVLECSKQGVLGMHPTLLPEGRGRASVPWAILKGLSETGVTLFKLDEGVDTGPIVDQIRIPIEASESATTLYSKVADAHVELMRDVWPRLVSGGITLEPQDEERATCWPGRRPEDGELRPETMRGSDVDRFVRALSRPYPGAFVRLDDGRTLRIWDGRFEGRSVPGSETFPVSTRDGTYYATDFVLEGAREQS